MFDTIEPWHWWVAAMAFVAVEVFAPGVLFLWLGIAAALVGFGLLAFPDLDIGIQVLAFGVLSVVSLVIGRTYVRRHPIETADPTLNRRGAALVGRVLTLVEPIRDGAAGRVKVGDTSWRAQGPGDRTLAAGSRVRVVAVSGASLVVEAAEDGFGAVEPPGQ